MDTPKELIERLDWMLYTIEESTGDRILSNFQIEVLKTVPTIIQHLIDRVEWLEEHVEGIESERNQYLDWFELHNFSIFDVLSDLKHANEIQFTKEK